MNKKDTSWGKVADWYDDLVLKEDSYQKTLILPNLLRITNIKKGENILDIGCGQGFFANEFNKEGAIVTGTDISTELIEKAKKSSSKLINYFVSDAGNLLNLKDNSFDKVFFILSIQNIENIERAFFEARRVLNTNGKIFMVINHPCFRIPQKSDWGFDENKKIQYRRVDQYMTESTIEINMHPGIKDSEKTFSFHRSLSTYFEVFRKTGFCILNIEEWVSNKKSQKGPRQMSEDKARKEVPLFMLIEAQKNPVSI
ncbi:MAG: class I SAM-dependent methyltransferase [Minisyncoccia bacterium]